MGLGLENARHLLAARQKRNCLQRQAYTINSPDDWFELAWDEDAVLPDGPGCIARIWFVISTNNLASRIRITFDDAEHAQIGGDAGVSIRDLFGGMGLVGPEIYRTNIWGQHMNSTPFGGFLNLKMPFCQNFKIEVKGSFAATWWMVEWLDGLPQPFNAMPPAYLYAEEIVQTLGSLDEQSIFDFTGDCSLILLSVNLTNGTMEGDFRMYDGADQSMLFRSSGFEDFFGSSFFFTDGKIRTDSVGLINLPSSAYRWFLPLTEAPNSTERLRVTFQNGDTGNNDPADLQVLRMYYAFTDRSAPTPEVLAAPSVVVAEDLSVSISWDGATSNGIAGYQLYANDALIYDGVLPRHTPGGALSTETTYSYKVSTYDFFGVESTKSSATTVTTRASEPSFGWDMPIGGASVGLGVSSWVESIGGTGIDFAQASGGAQPLYTATPSLSFNGSKWMAADDGADLANALFATPFSLHAQVKWDGTAGQQAIWGKYVSSGSKKSFWFALDASHHLIFGHSANGSTEVIATSTGTVTSGATTKLTITVDPTVSRITLYINGTASGQVTGSAFAFNSNDAQIELGSVDAGANNKFHGEIDFVKIWDHELAAGVVAGL